MSNHKDEKNKEELPEKKELEISEELVNDDEELAAIADDWFLMNPQYNNYQQAEEIEVTEEDVFIYDPESGSVTSDLKEASPAEDSPKYITERSQFEKSLIREVITSIVRDLNNTSNASLSAVKKNADNLPPESLLVIKDSIKKNFKEEATKYETLLLKEDYLDNDIITSAMKEEIQNRIDIFVRESFENYRNSSVKKMEKKINEMGNSLNALMNQVFEIQKDLEI